MLYMPVVQFAKSDTIYLTSNYNKPDTNFNHRYVFFFLFCVFLIVAIIFSFLVAEKEKSPHLLVDCCCLLKQVKCTLINCTLGDPTMDHLTP